jgi:hypothetical protein
LFVGFIVKIKEVVVFCGLVFLAGCVQQRPQPLSNKKYLEVKMEFMATQQGYEQQIDLVDQYNHAERDRERNQLNQQLKGQVLLANDRHNAYFDNLSFFESWGMSNPYRHYPFIQYKKSLDSAIDKLCSNQASLYLTDSQLAHDVDGLLADLEAVRQYVVTRKEYQQEWQTLEERRIAEEQAEAQRAQAAAMTSLACSVVTHAVVTAASENKKTTINNYKNCQLNENCQVNN